MTDYSDYKECTDCVHYEFCLRQEKFLIEHNRKDLLWRYGFGLSEPEICCNFRDRSRFVELPCKPGETIYRICPVNEGEPCCNCSWECCDCYDIGFQSNCSHNSIRVGTAGGVEWIMKRAHYFGKIYFSTREEAEQALKEREKDE